MPMTMLMVHGNLFGTKIWQSGPRGRDSFASTSMVMVDLGQSISDHHYLNLDVMLTAEKWTLPHDGYPLLFQIGEKNENGELFLDAQHPHSSPLMGLTVSDTISFGPEKNHVKLFFAPRGEATDGPVAFMHRPTGQVNPDAPLGHHIGQDVGHITSTVLGASLKWGDTRIEASAYHGTEPEPTKVDLPLGKPNSFSLRLVKEILPNWMAMISAARIEMPEPNEVGFENRYSASTYFQKPFSDNWTFYNTLIYGLVTQYDHADHLSSFAEEFLFRGTTPRIWGRIEVLERTPSELNINSDTHGKWIASLTAGYTHKIASWESLELGLGGSLTQSFLPTDFKNAYGGNPWSGKIFIQLAGMQMMNW